MSGTGIERVMKAVTGTPWAIALPKLEQIAQILVVKIESGDVPTSAAVEKRAADERDRPFAMRGSVAVIPVMGTIARRMNFMDALSGGTSIEIFERRFDEAMADDEVTSIVLSVDSPGGSVYGVEEIARKIYNARREKRIVAVVDGGLAASAAYYLASSATEVVASPSSEIGSIGVFGIHMDWSEYLAKEGIKPTLIKAGANKAEGAPHFPLTEEAAAHLQEAVDDYYDQFVRAVARNRGVSVKLVRGEAYGQGRTFTTKRALDRGMVDKVGTLEDVLADLTRKRRSSAGTRAEGDADIYEDLVLAPAAATESVTISAAADPARAFDVDAIGDRVLGAFESLLPKVGSGGTAGPSPATIRNEDDIEPEAGGDAAADETDSVPEALPAPAAREETVREGQDTAAPDKGAENQTPIDVEEIRAAERKRATELRAIASAHPEVSDEILAGWIESGTTVEAAEGEALRRIAEARKARGTVDVRVGADHEAERPYASLGLQLQDVVKASKHPHDIPKRLLYLNEQFSKQEMEILGAASGANVSSPSDGGFAVQFDFVEGIMSKAWDEGSVMSRTNQVPISSPSNALVRNQLKETSRAAGSRYGGVRVYWANEAGTVTASQQELRQQRIELEKLMGLYYATEETIQDAAALTVEAERGFRSELMFTIENAIFRGTGAGQPLGILNAAALATVTASTAAGEGVSVADLAGMMGRLWARSFPNAVWFITQYHIANLVQLTLGNQPVFVPGGSLAGAPFGFLFGMPIMPVEYTSAVGVVGDFVLADLSQYTTIAKGGPRWQESIHVRFINDETTFKLTYRVNGQPDWEAPITPAQDTNNTISPFITLSERST